MLIKLLKYELKNILKFLVIFYSLTVIFSVFTRVFLGIDNSVIMNIIGRICSGVAISMMFSTVINNLMRLWGRFRQNFYGDECYLTHTLPVTKSVHYTAKVLSAVISLFVSVAVIGASLFIAYYSDANMEMLKAVLLPIADAYGSTVTAILVLLLIVLFLEFLNALQCGYTGIILGHRMNSGKIAFSVLFGFLVNIASQVVMIVAVLVAGLFNSGLMNLLVTNEAVSTESVKSVIYLSIAVYSAIVILGYFINMKLFAKGVNVD